jgi:hypothetical protein
MGWMQTNIPIVWGCSTTEGWALMKKIFQDARRIDTQLNKLILHL